MLRPCGLTGLLEHHWNAPVTTPLLNRILAAEAALRGRELVAPLLGDGRIRVRVAGLIYTLAAQAPAPGWWRCRIADAAHAEVIGAAEPWQRGDYLALWPALRVVLLEPAGPAAWLALPLNPSDARQRCRLAGPQLLRLTEGGQPFERAIARVEGGALWYDDLDRRADPAVAEALRAACAAERLEPGVPGLNPGEQAAYALRIGRTAAAREEAARRTVEGRLRHAVGLAGARLLGYEPFGSGFRVTWERDGLVSTTLIDHDLSVTSAGICLSGEDHRFDLSSIVGVVAEAPGYAQ